MHFLNNRFGLFEPGCLLWGPSRKRQNSAKTVLDTDVIDDDESLNDESIMGGE